MVPTTSLPELPKSSRTLGKSQKPVVQNPKADLKKYKKDKSVYFLHIPLKGPHLGGELFLPSTIYVPICLPKLFDLLAPSNPLTKPSFYASVSDKTNHFTTTLNRYGRRQKFRKSSLRMYRIVHVLICFIWLNMFFLLGFWYVFDTNLRIYRLC